MMNCNKGDLTMANSGAISGIGSGADPFRGTPARAAASGAATASDRAALAMVEQLKARDTEVRQHEQAHLAAAGGLAVSGASYTYQRGPNGVNYAIGGEVQIDTAPGRTPRETIERAQRIAAAALAPAEPSGPDRAVAAQARQLELQARAELAVQQAEATPASSAAAGAPAAVSAQALARAYQISPAAAPSFSTSA